ncbi:TetR/AcrR family transcriptional regulator [Bacteroides sp. 214]|uniref:TetR/AcrR family transcriptional regulator n=1 Tax=Bacteroides sp. 214 TaxID=2302935 RepID=UPI0013D0CE7D|nr:TetR/AcrR family transcriptional regulator [Bacteroides sp. 214]NDW12900.1 TetR/AcrR family transcriptional regulator [Bacteroides sp. 214]
MTETVNDNSTRQELRERIIIASLDAFRKNGIKSITMDDIAALLKISKRTLYETFEDKETLLRESIIYNQQRMQKELAEFVARTPNVLEVVLTCFKESISVFHHVNIRFFEDLKKYPKVKEMLECRRKEDSEMAVNFLKRGVKQGLFRKDTNFEIVNILLKEQLALMMANDLLKKFSFIEVYESIVLTYLRGISTVEGVRELDEFVNNYKLERNELIKEKDNDII